MTEPVPFIDPIEPVTVIAEKAPFGGLLRLPNASAFTQRVALLAGGTAIALLIGFAVAPVLTRLYSPEVFGFLAVQSSIVAIVQMLVTGRYEVAIPLAQKREAAVNLSALAFAGLCLGSAVMAVVLRTFGGPIAHLLKLGNVGVFVWTVPAALVATGVYDMLTYIAIRRNEYRPLFTSKIVQVSAQSGAQIVFAAFGSWALLGGDVAGRAVASIVFAITALRRSRGAIAGISWGGIRDAAVAYRRVPLVYAWGSALNMANSQLVPLVIAGLFGPKTAGFFSLGYRVLFLPMGLIGMSVSQVFYGEAARLHQENPAALPSFVLSIALRLALLGLIPGAILAVAGPRLFALVFGAAWSEAGEVARILVIVFVVQFVYTPISVLFNVLGRQGAYFFWSVGLIVASMASLLVGARVASTHGALVIFAASNAVAYAAALITFTRWMAMEGRR